MTKIQLCLKVLQDHAKNTASGIAHLWHCLREDYPDFRDATDAAESFFDGHANKVFVAACVVSLFTSFWAWVAGAALGLFWGQKQKHIFPSPLALGYGSCGILIAYWILKPLIYGFASGCVAGQHLYHTRFRVVDLSSDGFGFSPQSH